MCDLGSMGRPRAKSERFEKVRDLSLYSAGDSRPLAEAKLWWIFKAFFTEAFH